MADHGRQPDLPRPAQVRRTRHERYVGQRIPEPLPEPAEWVSNRPGGPPDPAARFLESIAARAPGLTILERTVNGQPGLVAQLDGSTVMVFAFEIAADRVARIWAIRNPDKLRAWGSD